MGERVAPEPNRTAAPEKMSALDLSDASMEEIDQAAVDNWLPIYDENAVLDLEPDDPIYERAEEVSRGLARLAWDNPVWATEVATTLLGKYGWQAGETLVPDMVPGVLAHDLSAGIELLKSMLPHGGNVVSALKRAVENQQVESGDAIFALGQVARQQLEANKCLRAENEQLQSKDEMPSHAPGRIPPGKSTHQIMNVVSRVPGFTMGVMDGEINMKFMKEGDARDEK
ncbi:hypothetical protein [Nocardia fluminea]|uniref:hypothetical protein n=1 Tax=Nocardia fluminea TaxID=134984 RepID=UPI003D0A20AF